MRQLTFSVLILTLFTIVSCSKDDKDTTPPVITITSPAEGSTLEKGKSYPIVGTVTDDTELAEIEAGGVKITTFDPKNSYTFSNLNLPIPAETTLTDAKFTITAKDKAGNVTTKDVNFKIQ